MNGGHENAEEEEASGFEEHEWVAVETEKMVSRKKTRAAESVVEFGGGMDGNGNWNVVNERV